MEISILQKLSTDSQSPKRSQGFIFIVILVPKINRIFVFLSSPSACRTSGASKNRDWANENGTIFLCNFGVTVLVLVPWGSLDFLGVPFF